MTTTRVKEMCVKEGNKENDCYIRFDLVETGKKKKKNKWKNINNREKDAGASFALTHNSHTHIIIFIYIISNWIGFCSIV